MSLELSSFSRFEATTLTAGLLLDPKFHSNVFRIEILIDVVDQTCVGERKPSSADIKRWLNEYPELADQVKYEDPVEDSFIEKVTTKWGDFRIYGGIWEGYTFYLQRILNIISSIPQQFHPAELELPIKSLLTLSEEIATRNRARENSLSVNHDKEFIFPPNLSDLERRRDTLIFSSEDLIKLKINVESLRPFITTLGAKSEFQQKFLVQPIIECGNGIAVILPTAITWTIRLWFFNWINRKRLVESFHEQLVVEYYRLLQGLPSFGKLVPPELPFKPKEIDGAMFTEFMVEISQGRYFHIVLRAALLDDFTVDKINEPPASHQQIEIETRINKAFKHASLERGFKEGISLVVLAGFGRANFFGFNRPDNTWLVGAISADDLETMMWSPGASEKALWKLLKHEKFIEDLGVDFLNFNGVLNLFGWWEEQDHILVPSAVQVSGKQKQIIYIPTDAIAKVRRKTRSLQDRRSVQFIDGSLKDVRKKHLSSFFDEDLGRGLYHSFSDARDRKLLCCTLNGSKIWWIRITELDDRRNQGIKFRILDALHNWSYRILHALKYETSANPLLFELDFSQISSFDQFSDETPPMDSLVTFVADSYRSLIRIFPTQEFIHYLHHPENIAEASLVSACVEGFHGLNGLSLTEIQSVRLLKKIIPNLGARFIHFFKARSFREYLSYFRDNATTIDNSDANVLRIGLGHLNDNKAIVIKGKRECTKYLETLVTKLYNELRVDLMKYNKSSILKWFLINLEEIASDRSRWRRTARAVVSLHRDPMIVHSVRTDHFSKLNAADIASRLVIEIALSEASQIDGWMIDDYDASPLMAKASLIFHLGNRSDGIAKDIISPVIQVTPSGDVRTERAFEEEILYRMTGDYERSESELDVKTYEKHFKEDRFERGSFNAEFTQAFVAETGIPLTDIPKFLEVIEDIGFERNEAIFSMNSADLYSVFEKRRMVNEQTLISILSFFSSVPREKWEIPPPGYSNRDVSPWLFRRRLSLLMKPILKFDTINDTTFMLSPGFIMEAMAYTIDLYLKAGIEEDRCGSELMKKWVGDERRRRGAAFTMEVAKQFQELGFEVRIEIEIATIVGGKSLDRDYGDVDVIAWKPNSPSVILVECKDLLFAKTYKEIAEQLLEFKGELRNNKPDSLMKHLDRIEILNSHNAKLSHFLGTSDVKIDGCIVFSRNAPAIYNEASSEQITMISIEEISEFFG
jgi:hypothetical protein